ncbi:MAG: aminoglycoside phosphotransferase family protein [Anaerolineae bacterium]|nr:aminoglycoside phosphotransferase family protein [Anaerolineae bacterium]MCO5207581.1 aminoglycoside phosphotransferase family protein [Anaerolineae bacterium]
MLPIAVEPQKTRQARMTAAKMHVDEIETDAMLVRSLLAAQFPQWADLPVTRIESDGTDNAIYRLGDDKVVRLPIIYWATEQIHREHRWLPQIAPLLPLAVPVPIAKGEPGAGYLWHWSVYQWLEGDNAAIDRLVDPCAAALDLAHFILALQEIETDSAPDDSNRGQPLTRHDAQIRAGIMTLQDTFDTTVLSRIWDEAVNAPKWQGPPVWFHGDLKPGNLLAQDGRLSAVIDFGCMGVGDPACDMMAAWLFFSTESRTVFRTALQADDAIWARGRGWALYVGVMAFPYYRKTNPGFAAIAGRTLDELIVDYRVNG